MKTFDVQGIGISASPDTVFAFLRDAENLPRWAKAFESVDGCRASLRTPGGAVDIELETRDNPEARTVDWHMTFPDGSVALAQSRVTETGDDNSIYSFVLHAPPVPLAALEGALAQQIETLATELAALKAILEG